MVRYAASKYSDEDIASSLRENKPASKDRQKFLDSMMDPFKPSWMLQDDRKALGGKVIEGLDPWTAEGILQAIEDGGVITDEMWRAIWPIWADLLATAERLEQ